MTTSSPTASYENSALRQHSRLTNDRRESRCSSCSPHNAASRLAAPVNRRSHTRRRAKTSAHNRRAPINTCNVAMGTLKFAESPTIIIIFEKTRAVLSSSFVCVSTSTIVAFNWATNRQQKKRHQAARRRREPKNGDDECRWWPTAATSDNDGRRQRRLVGRRRRSCRKERKTRRHTRWMDERIAAGRELVSWARAVVVAIVCCCVVGAHHHLTRARNSRKRRRQSVERRATTTTD